MSRFVTASGEPPERALSRFKQAVLQRNQMAIEAGAALLKTEIVRQLSTPGQGRYYAKVARAAGETPKGPRTQQEATRLRQRRAGVRKLNAKRRGYAMALNAGAIEFGDITNARVLTGLHRASKPGDPPAPDTGFLRRSAFIERTGKGMRVGVSAPAALPLEFGTTRAGKARNVTIAPRPFMRPALAKVRAQLGPIFISTLRVR